MKKILFILFLAAIVCLSGCSLLAPNDTDTTAKDSASDSITSDAPEHDTTEEATETDPLPLPEDTVEFSFQSGAGAWRTVLTLNRDGTFSGFYLDSEMGEIGDDYPNGSAYVCDFTGTFDYVEKIDEYSYKLTLSAIHTEKEVGEEWIEDGIRYVASAPYGLNDPFSGQECTEFILYLPDTPIDSLSEEFLSWWPYRFAQDEEAKTTLSCYGILNVTANFGFFNVN